MQTLKLTKKYEKYPEYKDSGVEWLGKIPKEWRLDHLQHLFTKVKRMGFENEQLLSVYRDLGVIIKSSRDDNHNKASEDLSTYQLVEVGDLAINKMKAWQGSVAISTFRGIVSPAYFVCTPLTKNNLRFLHYLLRSDVYIKQYERNSGGVRNDQWDLDYGRFRKLEIPIPEFDEQNRIARYLDAKTSYIDQIIEKKQKLIELLHEKRTAVINNAVTKGIDSKAELVESGVEWIGKIPKSWMVKKIKHITRFEYGESLPDELREEGDVMVFGSNGRVGSHNISNTHNPVIIVGRKGSYGALNYSEKPVFAIDTTYFIDSRHTREDMRWLYYALSCVGLNTLSQDTGVPGLSRASAYEKLIPAPSLLEQSNIVSYLDGKTFECEVLIKKAQKSIELLQELKSSLISNVVTGKVKV